METLIGKYVNRKLYTDIEPVGRIIGTRGKTILILKMVIETRQTAEMKFISGGFAGVCTNMHEQEWEFEEVNNTFEIRMSKAFKRQFMIEDKPRKFYDYNF